MVETTADDWSVYWRVPVAYGYDPKDTDYVIIQVRDGNVIACGYDSVGDEYHKIVVNSEGKVVPDLRTAVFVWNTVKADNFRGRVGTWAEAVHANFWSYVVAGNVSTKAQNDEVSLGNLFIPETTDYTAYLIFEGNTDKGIAHFMLNGVDKGTIDMYNASLDANKTGSVSLGTLTAGHYAISIKIATKTGSEYYGLFQAVVIAKT